jgi:hypothetical protein
VQSTQSPELGCLARGLYWVLLGAKIRCILMINVIVFRFDNLETNLTRPLVYIRKAYTIRDMRTLDKLLLCAVLSSTPEPNE